MDSWRMRFWGVAAAFAVFGVMSAQAQIDPDSVAGVWLFDADDDETAVDTSENGFDGVVNGAEWDSNGKFGGALSFDGASTWVSVESDPRLQAGSAITFMAYFSADNIGDWRQLIAKNAEYLLRVDPPGEGNNMSAFVFAGGGWEGRASAGVPELNRWTHFAAVYQENPPGGEQNLRVFVDGVLMQEQARAGGVPGTANPVEFGRWGAGSYFSGLIDEVAIFNAALTADQILEISEDGLQVALGGGLAAAAAGKLAATWAELRSGN